MARVGASGPPHYYTPPISVPACRVLGVRTLAINKPPQKKNPTVCCGITTSPLHHGTIFPQYFLEYRCLDIQQKFGNKGRKSGNKGEKRVEADYNLYVSEGNGMRACRTP